MNVLKEAIQKLRSHLCRDKIGIDLLDSVTLIANEQRKRNAALAAEAENDRAETGAMRLQVHELQTQVARLKEELSRQSALCAAAQHREQAALAQLSKPEEMETMSDAELERRIEALLRNTQRRFKKLPACKNGRVYLEDLVPTYAYDEFAGLGMVMAVCAVMGCGIPALVAERSYKEIRRPKDYDPEMDVILARFVHWLRDAFGFTPMVDKVCNLMNLPRD